ncbi:MAG: DUF885 family protein, partial [Steroidobacter sp.]
MQDLTRRQMVTALASVAALPLLPGCTLTSTTSDDTPEARAKALLNSVAHNVLRQQPESVTFLGLDKVAYSAQWSQLSDLSIEGRRAFAKMISNDLARVSAFDTDALSFETRTSIEVIKSAYHTAVEGYALPYGDVATGSYRNSPYVVIQNTGAYIDVPRLLSAEHTVSVATDAESWMARLSQYPKALDGELERMRAARAIGLIPPRFLIEKTLTQLQLSATSAHEGGILAEFITSKTKNLHGNWPQQARKIL